MHIARVETQLEALERKTQALLDELETWPEELLQAHPPAGGWSVLEVLDHVIRVEAAAIGAVRAEAGTGRRISWIDRGRGVMVRLVLVTPIRLKVPAGAPGVVPKAPPTFSRCVQRWQRIREELGTLLRQLPEPDRQCGLMRHPVSGWMNAAETVQFLAAHLEHHRYQIARLRRG
jgi:uncharacterized damage-inducible protein DinB